MVEGDIEVFPDAARVFAEPVAAYARHLHPLVTLDLSAVDAAWNGRIHVVCPLEPFDGCVGEETTRHHGEYLRPNWIGFKLNSEDRYELLGDLRFFFLEDADAVGPYKNYRADLEAHYREQNSSFEARRAHYISSGGLYYPFRKGSPRVEDRIFPVDQIGGGVRGTNWTVGPSKFAVDSSNRTDVVPLTSDGRRFCFIAKVKGFHFRDFAADGILLFFDPTDRVALLTFDWG